MKKLCVLTGFLLLIQVDYAQSTLTIQTNAGLTPCCNFSTGFIIDSIQGEASGCVLGSGLFIFVIDTPSLVSGGCEPWATNYNGLNPDHNFGEIPCRSRPELYFQYRQSDPSDMQSLDSLINYHVPNGYVFGIYSWRSYDYLTINANCPALGSTLYNYWGPDATTEHTAAIFFAIKGQPSTYDMIYTNNAPDTIQMVKQICLPSPQTNIDMDANGKKNIYPNPFTQSLMITGSNNELFILTNTIGEVVYSTIITEDNYNFHSENLKSGVYFLHIGGAVKKIVKQDP
jgi:hypothetical protein